MEYVQGESLRAVLENGLLSKQGIRLLMNKILAAVRSMHAVGIIHRDLKPENIFLVPGGSDTRLLEIKIIDFGLSVNPYTQEKDKELLKPAGSLFYMHPRLLSNIVADKPAALSFTRGEEVRRLMHAYAYVMSITKGCRLICLPVEYCYLR